VHLNTIQNLTVESQLISVIIDVSVVTKVAGGFLLPLIDNRKSCIVELRIMQNVIRKLFSLAKQDLKQKKACTPQARKKGFFDT
jgi:hypothetical protein